MATLRKPFQGVLNIIRFNWHFYLLVMVLCWISLLSTFLLHNSLSTIVLLGIFLALIITVGSLIVSYYIYDVSDLYKLNWLPDDDSKLNILNIHAGFDETSALLKAKYFNSQLTVLDFYDPKKHTEISIKRAREAYPCYEGTVQTNTETLPLATNSIDKIFVIFAAHEIRNDGERIQFFKELNRALNANGEIFITEHLRDLPNFLAYNIGFLHFLAKDSWYNTFIKSNFVIKQEQKLNPFISTFTLHKNGNTY
jgi:SAM-dependent methyltransferase